MNIVDDGEIVTDESVTEFVDLFRTQAYEVVVEDEVPTTAREQIEREFNVNEWEKRGDWTVCEVSMADRALVHDLMGVLKEFDLAPRSVSVAEADLEEVFLEVTSEADAPRERDADRVTESRA